MNAAINNHATLRRDRSPDVKSPSKNWGTVARAVEGLIKCRPTCCFVSMVVVLVLGCGHSNAIESDFCSRSRGAIEIAMRQVDHAYELLDDRPPYNTRDQCGMITRNLSYADGVLAGFGIGIATFADNKVVADVHDQLTTHVKGMMISDLLKVHCVIPSHELSTDERIATRDRLQTAMVRLKAIAARCKK